MNSSSYMSMLEKVGALEHPPYKHQLKYMELEAALKGRGLFWQMGTGKSAAIIWNASWLYTIGEICTLLIVALNGVHENWSLREIPKHIPKNIGYDLLTYSSYLWSTKKGQRQITNITTPGKTLRILVMNVEAFSRGKGTDLARRFMELGGGTLMVVDESSTIKDSDSKRTKNIMRLGHYAKYRRALTGTPITESPFNYFSQLEFIEPKSTNCKSFFHFTRRYGVFKTVMLRVKGGAIDKTYEELLQYQSLPQLRTIAQMYSTEVLKRDCLDLPDKIYERRQVPMSKQQEQHYSTMKAACVAWFALGEVQAENALSKLTRLHQICCGYLPIQDLNGNETLESIPHNRIDVLRNLLTEAPGKCIIWCRYRYSISEIKEMLDKTYGTDSYVEYHGGIDNKERNNAVDKFQDPNSGVDYFLGTMSAGSYGLTLTEAQDVIYYQNMFSLERRLQSEDRCHRIGQTEHVTYTDLVCAGTIDEDIIDALHSKVDVASNVTTLAQTWLK